jgi:hypothetical protein
MCVLLALNLSSPTQLQSTRALRQKAQGADAEDDFNAHVRLMRQCYGGSDYSFIVCGAATFFRSCARGSLLDQFVSRFARVNVLSMFGFDAD